MIGSELRVLIHYDSMNYWLSILMSCSWVMLSSLSYLGQLRPIEKSVGIFCYLFTLTLPNLNPYAAIG